MTNLATTILSYSIAGLHATGAIASLMALVQLYRRRRFQPILGRLTSGGYLVIPIGLSISLIMAFQAVDLVMPHMACSVKSTLTRASVPLLSVLYLARSAILLNQHNRSKAMKSMVTETKTVYQARDQLRLHNAPKARRLPPMPLIYFGIFLSISVMLGTTVWNDVIGECQSRNDAELVWGMLVIGATIYMATQLNDCHDAFGISYELSSVAILLLCASGINTIIGDKMLSVDPRRLSVRFLMLGEAACLVWISLGRPVYRSYFVLQSVTMPEVIRTGRFSVSISKRPSGMATSMLNTGSGFGTGTGTTPKPVYTLEYVLSNTDLRAEFAGFLKQEFSLENL